ncbi:MAG: aminotransferase class V-fold PLP-dependent enzyme [Gemmatimonadota bacterium]
MSHRRLFLKQLASLGAVAGLGSLAAAEEALASGLDRLAAEPRRRLGAEYLLDPGVVYLNHGSIGTIPRLVHQAHVAYLRLCERNPWLYMWGGEWEEPREQVRIKAAGVLGARPDEVALTHNTTEGFNILAQGLSLGPGDEVLFSSLNHDGASVCWEHQAAARGYEVRRFDFPVGEVSGMSVEDVVAVHARQIRDHTRVLVFPHVDNILGLRHPMRELTRMAHRRGVEYVAVDGAQTVGMVPVDVADGGVDFYAASPHKWIQAPKGLGLLYVREQVQERVRPMWVTWGQERWAGTVRAFEDYGTRNLPELLAMGDAIDFQERLAGGDRAARYRRLWEGWRAAVDAEPRIHWRSPTSWELSASLFALEVEGVQSRDLSRRLYEEGGFVFRPFHTQGLNTARISPNLATTDRERDRFLEAAGRMAR